MVIQINHLYLEKKQSLNEETRNCMQILVCLKRQSAGVAQWVRQHLRRTWTGDVSVLERQLSMFS